MTIYRDFFEESYSIKESLEDGILYHATNKKFKNILPRSQGIHLMQDLDGAIDVANSRNWKDYRVLKVYVQKDKLKPLYIGVDIEVWTVKNLAKRLLENELKDSKQDIKEVLESILRKEKTDQFDFYSLRMCLDKIGYNCISYLNEVEHSEYPSIMLFDQSFIIGTEEIGLE